MTRPKPDTRTREPNTLLACNHWSIFDPPPSKGDTVWCHGCEDYSSVIGGNLRYRKAGDRKEFEYVVTCNHEDFRRKEMDLKTAEILGDSHVIRTGHVVTVRDRTGKTVTRITPDRIDRVTVTGL